MTVFLYLNDVEEGGATAFPELNLTVVPKAGRALLWPSVLNEQPSKIDWSTEHEAMEVTRGTKYGANVWFHLKPFRLAYTKYHCCEKRRRYLENGPNAWERGDVDWTFERIVQDDHFQHEYNTTVLSSPASNGPWVLVLDDFVTAQEASRLIELGEAEGFKTSKLAGGVVKTSKRTSLTSWCEEECKEDPIVQEIFARIYNLTHLGSEYAANMQLLKYETGQL